MKTFHDPSLPKNNYVTSWDRNDVVLVGILGAFHLLSKFRLGCQWNMFHTFKWKIPKHTAVSGSLKMYSPVFPLETILVEMHVPFTSFTRIHQSQAVHGDIGATISDFSKSWEWMELVSMELHSSPNGPFHQSFWKCLVDGKCPLYTKN